VAGAGSKGHRTKVTVTGRAWQAKSQYLREETGVTTGRLVQRVEAWSTV